jgi:hypothetical protein
LQQQPARAVAVPDCCRPHHAQVRAACPLVPPGCCLSVPAGTTWPTLMGACWTLAGCCQTLPARPLTAPTPATPPAALHRRPGARPSTRWMSRADDARPGCGVCSRGRGCCLWCRLGVWGLRHVRVVQQQGRGHGLLRGRVVVVVVRRCIVVAWRRGTNCELVRAGCMVQGVQRGRREQQEPRRRCWRVHAWCVVGTVQEAARLAAPTFANRWSAPACRPGLQSLCRADG